ncbi:conserved hypothetical protein [Tenacibaculum sp. 190524A05c]|uniref:hypothetical protein n=1 Tax=Tenacibaculum platacis TaxID=3137852 RepID=UPI0031FA7BCD
METAINNRNEAFFSIIEKLPAKRQLVLELIKENVQITAQDLSEKYGKPINEITGRITELKKCFLVVECGHKFNRFTNYKNTLVRVVKSVNERIDLINQRFIELRQQEDDLVNDYNLNFSDLTKELILRKIKKIKSEINSLSKILDKIESVN